MDDEEEVIMIGNYDAADDHFRNKHRKLNDNDNNDPAAAALNFAARSYQLEALEKAKRENTIVFLETGSGKTLIAIMLLRNYAYLLRKPSQFVVVFLVPTVVLVTQRSRLIFCINFSFHESFSISCDFMCLRRKWKFPSVFFFSLQLLVMTPQILLDALRHSFLKLDTIKLLIFDECHNARGRSPYACIMTEFYHPQLRSDSALLPRIFGLTASPINSKGSSSSNKYGKKILELESLMNSKVYTVAHESVLAEFIPFAKTKLKFYKHVDMPPALFVKLADHLKRAKLKNEQSLKELHPEDTAEESALKKVSKLFATFMYCLTDLGVWLALKAAESISRTEAHHLFWGNSKDGIIQSIIISFSEDVFQAFSACVPSVVDLANSD
ncbi:DNA/RNA helicase [Macleaya cordata]|uniref:DNA/RNA helicase n=1 Tax=Macleaya cordata TaxID=56857 RepID=A0A200PXX8_MACCD|nr:DNA/RNA helicase [Macleaya cordata]